MEILDGKRDDKAIQPFFLDRIVGFLNGGSDSGRLDVRGVSKNYTPEQVRQGDAVFAKTAGPSRDPRDVPASSFHFASVSRPHLKT
jgi:hypothetical protein